jgi:type II secretory pathway pseudopilin PulG
LSPQHLIPHQIQAPLRKHINEVAKRVCKNFDQHADERNLMGAFNQALKDSPASFGGAEVSFDFRNFPDQTEEPESGADGGYIVTIESAGQKTVKAEIHQAKRLAHNGIRRNIRIRQSDADRLKGQAAKICNTSRDAAIIVVTKGGIYAVDARQIAAAADEREPFRNARIVSIGTFLGVWLARCTRGQKDPDFVNRVRNPGGFLFSYLHMRILVQ